MEIYEFRFENYYRGSRIGVVLAVNKDEGLRLLKENPKYKDYLEDPEAELKTFTKRFLRSQVIGLY